ncbi:MAG: amidohydrolase family protein [Cyclobacteriaceae bacterium]|nr:amidohydrolase family protein [Cyclobacteriaceae bacterium]
MLDFLIKNAIIYDGLGGKPFKGAIGIKDELIASIFNEGEQLPEAETVIYANGLALTPGFIVTHASTGFGFFFPHAANHKLYQGITTEIFGNCGTSPAPIDTHLISTMKTLATDLGFDFNWRTLGAYFEILEKAGLQFNVATLTGHSTLRGGAVKDWAFSSDSEQGQMQQLMQESMEDGSLGLSTGLIYAPGCFAKTDEIIKLAKIAKANGGVYASHIRDERDKLEEAIEETLIIGEAAGINVLVSHLKAAEKRNFGKIDKVLKRLEQYNQTHTQQAKIDVYPYTAVSTKLRAFIPKEFLEGGLSEIKDKLDSKEVVEEIADYIINRDYDLSQMLIISNEYPEWEGKDVQAIANEFDWSLAQTVCEILKRDTEMWIVYHCIDQADIDKAIIWPNAMICTDSWSHPINAPKRIGVPHPRSYGAFTEFLKRYVFDTNMLSFEEAIRKITSMPADYFNLRARGRIKIGYKADVVLFKQSEIAPKATYSDPYQLSTGVEHLWVNGVHLIESNVINNSKPGVIIRNRD